MPRDIHTIRRDTHHYARNQYLLGGLISLGGSVVTLLYASRWMFLAFAFLVGCCARGAYTEHRKRAVAEARNWSNDE